MADITVTFEIFGESHRWETDDTNLLDFAERHGIPIDSGCRYGDCGACMTQIVSGEVAYLHETGIEPDSNACLPCSSKPKTSIVLLA